MPDSATFLGDRRLHTPDDHLGRLRERQPGSPSALGSTATPSFDREPVFP
jgi:hypothetical protein